MSLSLGFTLSFLLATSTPARATAPDSVELGFLRTSLRLDPDFRVQPEEFRRSAREGLKEEELSPARAFALEALADDLEVLNQHGFDVSRARRLIINQALVSDVHPQARTAHGLTRLEAAAISGYSGNIYKFVNPILRAENPPADVIAYRDFLNRALDKLPVYKGRVERGMNLFPGWRDVYKRPSVTEKAFTSTSTHLDGTAYDAGLRLVIWSRTGRDISTLSTSGKEREVLFKAGTDFIIDATEETSNPSNRGQVTIRMRERAP